MAIAGETSANGVLGPAAPARGHIRQEGTSRRWRLPRLENIVMLGGVLALGILVVFPLLTLLISSIRGEEGISFEHFVEALTGRLYVQALLNSVILGGWTALFSIVIGVPLAWAVSRTNVPGKKLIHLTATLAYLSPPFLIAIAFVNLFSPNAGLINVFLRDVIGAPWLTFNVFSMAGLVLVTVLHTFPFVYLLASSALQSVDASYEEAAQILGAGKLRTALSITGPLVAPAILSGHACSPSSTASRCSARRRSSACRAASSRCRRASTRSSTIPPQVRARLGALAALHHHHGRGAVFQRSFLAKRSYVTLGGKGSRPQ
jgi:iron(III) transport system permease protein